MIRINSFPFISDIEKKPSDGVYEKKFIFCDRNHNHKCIEHYKSIKNKKGFHICPYGFSSYVTELNLQPIIYSSLEIKGYTNRKFLRKNKNKNDEKRLFLEQELKKIVDWESNIEANINAKTNILRNYDQSVKVVSQKKEVLDDTLHELRKLNNVLKKQAFILKSELEKNNARFQELKIRSKNIYSTSQLVSARLNAYDFTLNPEIIESNPPIKISLYRKFEKARHCLEVITDEMNINIDFSGTSRSMGEFYEIIDILPFILFENAIKFNYDKNPITCEFIESENSLKEIIIKNKTQLPQEKDLDKLKQKHFRSQSIEDIVGSGKGLYIASLICDYHNIEMTIETKHNEVINGKAIGDFMIRLNISETNT